MDRADRLKSRRGFLLSAAALIAAHRTAASQSRRTWRIGYLAALAPEDNVPYSQAFRDGLRALGYVEGDDVSIDPHVAADAKQLPALAADLVARNVDLIVALATPAARAAKAATTPFRLCLRVRQTR
jgi:putative tryptophan/tyrosine transport system substrate-binding protein